MKNNKFWELKQSDNPENLELYIYTVVESDGWIKSETSANHFRDMLSEYPDVKNIDIYINSQGGSVMEGIAIYNQLRRHKAFKTVYIDGFACSIASVIAMAGDKIIMPENTVMMIHNAWTFAYGNSEQLRKTADDLDTITEASRQAYLIKSNGKISEEKLIELMNAETYLTAKQCIEYGLADEFAETNKNNNSKVSQILREIPQNMAVNTILKFF